MSRLIRHRATQTADLSGLYARHGRMVWRTLLRLGVHPSGIEDAVQDVFLTAHQTLERFEGRSTPLTWLVGISVKVAANARRGAKRRAYQPLEQEPPSDDPGPLESLEALRRLRELDTLLSLLPDEQRQVIVLMELEHLGAQDVSDALGVKVNTVYSRLRLARQTLAKVIQATRGAA